MQRNWEEEMLAEYLVTHFPREHTIQRVRLGPITIAGGNEHLSEAERRMVGASFRRWADAVVVTADQLIVIEAALTPDPGDISRLQTYLLLVPTTPELQEFSGRALVGRLVWAVEDPYSKAVAVRAGFQVDLFRPSHFAEWIKTVRLRELTPPRTPKALIEPGAA